MVSTTGCQPSKKQLEIPRQSRHNKHGDIRPGNKAKANTPWGTADKREKWSLVQAEIKRGEEEVRAARAARMA